MDHAAADGADHLPSWSDGEKGGESTRPAAGAAGAGAGAGVTSPGAELRLTSASSPSLGSWTRSACWGASAAGGGTSASTVGEDGTSETGPLPVTGAAESERDSEMLIQALLIIHIQGYAVGPMINNALTLAYPSLSSP